MVSGGWIYFAERMAKIAQKIAVTDTIFCFSRIKTFPNLPLISIIFSESHSNNTYFHDVFYIDFFDIDIRYN
jgi:hypothetical protein